MNKRLLALMLLIPILAACAAPTPVELDGGYGTLLEPFLGVPVTAAATPAPSKRISGDDMPISRALAAKMLALAFADQSEIDAAYRIITFADTSPARWYDRYINKAYTLGLMSGGDNLFRPESPLTLEQAQFLLERLNPANTIRIQLTEQNRGAPISYALWLDLYIQTLNAVSGGDILGHFGITQENLIILATPETHPQLPEGNVITAGGPFRNAGLPLGGYIDSEIAILRRGQEIIAVVGVVSERPVIRNAYIVGLEAGQLVIFAGGAQRSFTFDGSLPRGRIGDVQIYNGHVVGIAAFADTVNGSIHAADYGTIELAGIGLLVTHPDFRIYSTVGGAVTLRDISALIVGANIAEFIVRDGQIAAAVITRRPLPENIRVVISTTGFGSYVHSAVEVSSENGFVLKHGDDIREFAANEHFAISATQNTNLTERIFIIPNNQGRTAIHSIRRNWPNNAPPQYRGIIEIARHDGGFVIINELTFEQYLYAVVPSEMPAAHGLEAAKVQAITARSYAYNQFHANRFHALGANIDDSIHSQVYNNIPENDLSIAAVNATSGMYLTYNGRVVSANFFSTSSGVTANFSDVWLDWQTGEFAPASPGYLSSQPQYLAGNFGDLSQEANARRFFMDTTVPSYDDAFAWFRWNLELTPAQLTGIINNNLAAHGNSNRIKLYEDGGFRHAPVFNIGDFRSMQVASRGQGGNIREIIITGSTATILVRTEYTIRRILAPNLAGNSIPINRHNAEPAHNFFMLPSTFMVFEQSAAGGLLFYGGGFGHGVGMSQNGVRGMIDRGYNYEQILAHYYPGTRIMTLTQ